MRLSIQLPFDVLQSTVLSKCMSWLKPFWHVMWYSSISNNRSIYMSHGINSNKNGFIPHPYNQQHNAGTKTNWSSGGRSNSAVKLIPRGGFFLVNKINVLHICYLNNGSPSVNLNYQVQIFMQCNFSGWIMDFFHVLPWRKIHWLNLDQDHHDPMTTNWLFLNELFLILNKNSCFDDNRIFSKSTPSSLFLNKNWFG